MPCKGEKSLTPENGYQLIQRWDIVLLKDVPKGAPGKGLWLSFKPFAQ